MQNIFHVNSLNDKGLQLNATWDGKVCKFALSNISNKDIALGDITLLRANMPFSKDTDTYKQGYISPAYFTEPRYSKYFRKYGIYEYVVFAKEGSIKDGLVEFRYDKILAKDRVY